MKRKHMFIIFCVSFILSALIYKRSINPTLLADLSSTFALSMNEGDGAFVYERRNITIKKNDVVQVVPKNAVYTGAVYSSSNPLVATVDSNGNIYGFSNGKATITAKNNEGKTANLDVTVSSFVVTLDPGHGGKDSGASRRNAYEKDMVMDISGCCRKELDKYSGITVKQTHMNDVYIPLEERAIIAKNQNANLFISMHINASSDHNDKGALVIISNSKYKKVYNERSNILGNMILNELTHCGLQKKEVLTRTFDNYRYSFDGSLVDYYGVIRHSIEREIPAIIIEHGFIDSSDYARLNTFNKRSKIGICDAKAIAKYLNLRKATAKTLMPVLATKLDLHTYRKTLKLGTRFNLSTMIYPSLTSNKRLQYSSNNPSVATVNVNGQIITKKRGRTIINVSTTDGSNLHKKCTLIVK